MNVTVNSQSLAAELRLLAKVVPSKPAIAILGHALLRADERLNLYATDLEVALGSHCAAQVDVPGSITVPAAKLLSMVEQFPDGDVNISLDGGHVIVRCGAFKSRLQSMRADDFPTPPVLEGTACTLDAGTLLWLLGKARHATSSTATKHVLQGALLKMVGEAAAIVATDGKRLVLATAGRRGPDMEFVIPSKTMDVLAGQLGVGDVEMTLGPRHLFFSLGDRMLTSRTIDGKFPAYDRIIPRDNDKIVTFDRASLTAALRRVVLAAEENGAVRMNLTSNILELSAASAGIGSANEVVNVEYTGEPLKASVNGGYVLDFLDVSTEPTMTMELKDATSAALLKDGRGCLSVIMLMRG